MCGLEGAVGHRGCTELPHSSAWHCIVLHLVDGQSSLASVQQLRRSVFCHSSPSWGTQDCRELGAFHVKLIMHDAAGGVTLVGMMQVAVYDGSWSEWGSRQDTPIDTGE